MKPTGRVMVTLIATVARDSSRGLRIVGRLRRGCLERHPGSGEVTRQEAVDFVKQRFVMAHPHVAPGFVADEAGAWDSFCEIAGRCIGAEAVVTDTGDQR